MIQLQIFPWLGGCCSFIFTLKREKLLFLSVGVTSPQPEMGTSVQASLQRADMEIKTALRKLVDSASLLVTLPPGMRGGAGGLGLPGSVPSDLSETAARPSAAVYEASTQTQSAGGHGRFGVSLENVPWETRETKTLNVPMIIFSPHFSILLCFEQFKTKRGCSDPKKHGSVGWG